MYVTLANDEIPLDVLTRIAEGEMDAYFHEIILDRAESYYDERYWTLGAVGGGSLHATVRGTRGLQRTIEGGYKRYLSGLQLPL